MDDIRPQRLEALSAHVEGLQAALVALAADGSSGASIRRIARSLGTAAEVEGAIQLARLALAVREADEEELEQSTRDLLEYFAALRRNLPGHEVHVLVVEDNRTVAAAVQAYLAGSGRKLHHAANAAEAERVLAEHPIDIVILDLILPDRDGRDLLVQMREDPATASMPVLVLSAAEGAVARAECLAVGASEFLEKPADPAQLRDAVTRHVIGRTRRAQSRHDEVTGLLNRAGLAEAFGAATAETSADRPLVVALLAVNELDRVTEVLGEESRDRLLGMVASQTEVGLDQTDTLGRWGNAELVALFPDSSSADAKSKLKAGLGRLAEGDDLREYYDSGIQLSFSAGVALADPSQGFREVVSAAERSLFRAKDSGRRVVLGASDEEASGDEYRPRVLLVEDDRVTATLIHHRLVREGFEVMDFLNGDDAYRWAAESTFDLAILDVKVPGMDGFELLEKLRSMPRCASVPIVMLTGLGSEADVVRGLELGANDYMLKPFSPTELLARARRLVYAHATADRGAETSEREDPAEAGAHTDR